MKQLQQEALPSAANQLRRRVEKWRKSKEDRFSLTPTELWDEAVPLAVKYGVCRVARAVGLDYGGLRKRVAAATEKTGPAQPVTFLELHSSGAPREGSPSPEPYPTSVPEPEGWIDIARPDGARMRISLRPGKGLDFPAIVAAFAGSAG